MNTPVQRTRLVSDVERSAFVRDGIVKLSGLLDQVWLNHLAEAVDEIRETVHREHPECIANDGSCYSENAWTFNEKMKWFAFESVVAAAASEVMASREVRLFETLTLYRPKSSGGTGWHQDISQHGISGQQTCSAWLSLERVEEKTGSLRVAAGSHLGPWYTPMTMPPGREHDLIELEGGPLPDPDTDRERFPKIISYAAEPGDVLMFHPGVLHSTRDTSEEVLRRSISLRLLGDDIRRKASRCEWHSWLKELPIRDGEPMISDRFPLLWPR